MLQSEIGKAARAKRREKKTWILEIGKTARAKRRRKCWNWKNCPREAINKMLKLEIEKTAHAKRRRKIEKSKEEY